MKITDYKHLQESIRIDIAVGYIQHELRKIFPDLRDSDMWNALDKEVARLTSNKTMAPVRDFWNLVDAISYGLKLKNLVVRLTSQNIVWTKESLLIDSVHMGAKSDFMCLETLGIDRPNGKQIRDFLFDSQNGEILKNARQDSEYNSKKTFDRDSYPIIVGPKDNILVVYDGNRRLIKAILDKQEKIVVYKATVLQEPMLFNYWIPTSRILSLVTQANQFFQEENNVAARSTAQTLGYLLSTSAVGQTEFYERVIIQPLLVGREFILQEVEQIISM